VENYDGTIFGFLGKIPVGLVVAPIKQQKDVVPSSAADFNLTVRNIGVSGPDTFDISLTMGAMGWTVDLYEGDGVSPLTDTDGDGIVDTGPLATSETKTLIARMTIPPDADIGDEETSILTFSSSNDLAVTKSALITATVPPPGVWIGPRQFFPLRPGDIASATLEVRNKGAMPDTIDLTTSDVLAWPTALYESDGVTPLSDHDGDGIPDTDVIGGLGSSTIVVEVQVPIDAEMGSVNRVTVTGTSSLDPNASGSRDIVIELAAPPNDEWPMFHNDVSRRGEWPGAMSPPLEMRWVDRNGTEVGVWYVSPAYADGMLFTTNADGYIRAHDAISGELIWARKIGMEYYYTTSPNVYDGMVITSFYTLTGAGTMFAFDEFTGETLWSFGPGSGFELAARTEKLVIDGLAFGTAWSGEIFALDAYTGALVWSTNVGMRPVGGLAAGAGALFCPTDEGYLVAIDQQTGAYLWSSPLDYTAAVTPVYGEGCVYVGTQMGTMYAIDAGTGDLVWRTGSLGSFWFSSPAYHTGLLYFGTDAARYYAMDASDGSIVWSTSGTDWVECGPVYSNGHLYFTEWDGQLRVLDAEDGSVVEIHYLEGYVECSPAAGDGWVWVQDSYGNLYAFEGLQPVGVRIQPSTARISACPGTRVDIAIDVVNSGSLPTDTFDLYASTGPLGWETDLLSSDGVTPLTDTDGDGIIDTGPVASREATKIIARVTVPPSAGVGDADTLTIDFVSSNDPSVSRTGRYTTEVPPPGVEIGPDAFEYAKPGDTVEKKMTVKNTGGFPDTIDVEAQSGHGWPVSLLTADGITPLSDTDGDGVPDVGLLGGLESAVIVVRIEVPLVAPLGTSDITIVTGRSSVDPLASDSATVKIEISPEPEVWWPTYQNNAARQGRSPSLVTPPLSVEWWTWDVDMGGVSLIADDGLLFALGYNEMNGTRSIVLAFDAYSGGRVWQKDMGGVSTYIESTPVAYRGMVYVTYYDYLNYKGWLVALDEYTGELVWRLGQSDGVDVDSAPELVASDDVVFASTTDGRVFAADARTGDLLWQTLSSGARAAGITVVGGVVYVVYDSYGTPCAAFDQATGTMIWYTTIGATWPAGPGTYARGSLFVAVQDGYVVSLDAADGTVRWISEYLGWMYWKSPAYDGERLYIGGAYFMNALDVETGELIWRYYTPGYCYIAPAAVANGYVYCADSYGYLIALDAATGAYAWHYYFGTQLYNCPVISEGYLWIAASDGQLWAFRGEIPAGIAVSPAYQEERALPNDVIDYEVLVRNLGTLPYDTIDVTVASGPFGWMVELLAGDHATPLGDTDSDGIPDTGPIAHDETVSIVVRITVPAGVHPGDEEQTVATFTSSNDPTVSRHARMASIVPPPGATIGPRQFFSAAPGTNLSATLQVENAGPLPDTFDLRAQSASSWTTELLGEDGATPLPDTDGDGVPDTGELAPRGVTTVTVRILVPPGAHTGSLDVTHVSATSSIDISRTASTAVFVEITGPPSEDWPTVLHDNARTGVAPEAFDLPLSPVWSIEVSGYPVNWYGAVISEGAVYFTDESVGVGALDLATGEPIWYSQLADAEYGFVGPPTVAYGRVYLAADVLNGVEMYCLDASTGKPLWRSGPYPGTWSTYTIPVVTSGMVLWSVYGEGWLYANDALTGELLWSFMMPTWCSDGPTYWQGMVYVADEWGNVAA
ncbi:MAG: PQQ-binding-like beta-propeller repeat protein, partial [Thermoplasmata archaeon]